MDPPLSQAVACGSNDDRLHRVTHLLRYEQVRPAAVAVVRPAAIVGREVWLVDEGFTTGAAVAECARVLRRAGASKIYVATVARTLNADIRSTGLLQNLAEAGTQDQAMLAAS